MKRAIDVPPFGELADPRVLAELAAAAEQRGWDGFFVWDHILHRSPAKAIADPWGALAAVACATSTLRIGPMVGLVPDEVPGCHCVALSHPRELAGLLVSCLS